MTSIPPRILSRLRLKHLDLFRHVAQQQTLRRAAELMHMTQPAATKLVQELEEIFGAPLFVRDRRGARLTVEGQVLHRYVGILLADITRMAEEIALVHEGGSGHIRLGVLPSLAPGLLTRAVSMMFRAHPRVRITVREGSTKELLAAVEGNELDLAFARVLDRPEVAELKMTKIYSEPFAVVIRRGHPMAKIPPRRRWAALAKADWVLPEPGTPMRAVIDHLFAANGELRPQPVVECQTLERISDFVAGSDMAGVLPRSFANHGDRRRKLAALVDIDFAPTFLVARAQDEPAPVTTEFMRIVQLAAANLQLT